MPTSYSAFEHGTTTTINKVNTIISNTRPYGSAHPDDDVREHPDPEDNNNYNHNVE